MRWGQLLLAASLAGAAGVGCGSSSTDGGSVLGNNYACDIGGGATHSCVVWSWNGGSQSNSDWKRYCEQMGGMPRRGCDVKMAVAGCATTSGGFSGTTTTTWWFYDGDTADLKMQCERNGGTFVPGPAGGSLNDMGGNRFRLTEGIYQVSGTVTMGAGCQGDPVSETQPSAGQIWALKNDDAGNIRLNFPSLPTMPASKQAYGLEVGNPPQPAQGASCPGTNNPAQCATEPGARPYANDQVTLVRDNDMFFNACRLHRHIVNQVVVTADDKFSATFTRFDSAHSGCAGNNSNCTTNMTWDFVFMRKFGL